jgi:threonine dehydratase
VIGVGDIEAAAARLQGVSLRTPLIQNVELNEALGGTVLIKPECLQVTGSFKIRGAYNRLSQLTTQQASNGVVAWSSGNHAQGVAAAGAMLGIRTTIVMPQDAPKAKLNNTRRLGGEVITYDRYNGDREAIAREIAAQRGAALVPSYDHDQIIAGQGSIGLEIADDALQMGLAPELILIPCGGGGLSSGCAIALKSRLPGADVIAVEPVDFNDTARSFVAGKRLRIDDSARSICDALQSPMPGELTFPILQKLVREVLVVSDAEVRSAMRFAFRNLKLVVEPGGAVALAALLSGKLDVVGKTTAIVLSGGNIDVDLFAEIQEEPD